MSKNILFPQAMDVEDGNGEKITLSMKEATLRNIFDRRRSYMMITTPKGQNLVGGGMIRYRIPLINTSKDYDKTNNVASGTAYEEVYVNIENVRTQGVEINKFDYSMLVNGGELQAETLANVQESIICDKNMYFFNGLKTFFDEHPEKTIYLPDLSTMKVLSQDALRSLQKILQVNIAQISRTMNKKYVGVPSNELFTIVDAYAAINANLLLTGLNASDRAYMTLVLGIVGPENGGDFRLGGNLYVIDNFLEQNLPANFSFNETAMDLSNYNGFILHRDAVAFPFGIQDTYAWINQHSHKPEFWVDYCFGFKVVREDLVRAYVKDMRAVNNPTIYVNQTSDISSLTNVNANFIDVRLSSSDESVAQIVGTKIKGIATGKADITLTTSDGEELTFSVAVAEEKK